MQPYTVTVPYNDLKQFELDQKKLKICLEAIDWANEHDTLSLQGYKDLIRELLKRLEKLDEYFSS